MEVRSRYRILSLLLILIANLLWGWISGLLIYLSIQDPDFIREMPPGPLILVSLIFLMELILLNIFFKDCRRIRMNDEKNHFYKPSFALHQKKLPMEKIRLSSYGNRICQTGRCF